DHHPSSGAHAPQPANASGTATAKNASCAVSSIQVTDRYSSARSTCAIGTSVRFATGIAANAATMSGRTPSSRVICSITGARTTPPAANSAADPASTTAAWWYISGAGSSG